MRAGAVAAPPDQRLFLGGLTTEQVNIIARQASIRGLPYRLAASPTDIAAATARSLLLLGADAAFKPASTGWLDIVARGQATILIDAAASLERAVEALRRGFIDYIDWPAAGDALWQAIGQRAPAVTRSAHAEDCPLLHQSAVMTALVASLRRLARRDCTVLITGETGTGKELAAELLHRESDRRDGPFVRLNCAALPEGMIEAELFGYERGAFTGAAQAFPGRLIEADGGTLFLDEVGDLPLSAQVRMLRALEAREVITLGRRGARTVDIRIISATNQPLEALIAQRRFREDLYWRLNVTQVRMPSLRERRDDIPLLAAHFLRLSGRVARHPSGGIAPAVLAAMELYRWPGNVRELRNVIEHGVAVSDGDVLTLADLPERIRGSAGADGGDEGTGAALHERERLLAALTALRWNKTEVARSFNWSRMTLYRKLRSHGIDGAT